MADHATGKTIPKPQCFWECDVCTEGGADQNCHPANVMSLDTVDGELKWVCDACACDYGTNNAEQDGSGCVMLLTEYLAKGDGLND